MVLFLFLLAKKAPASLPSAHFVVPRFSCWSLSHSASSSLISTVPTSLPLLFLFPLRLALTLLHFLLSSFRLSRSLWLTYLLSTPALSGYNESLFTHFFRGMTRPISSPSGVRCPSLLQPSTVQYYLSPLTSRIHFSFLGLRRTVSSKFFDTQVPYHTRCVLSHFRCIGHILLCLCRTERPLCSAYGHPTQDTSPILHCSATDSYYRLLLAAPFLYDLRSQALGELLGFWGTMVSSHAPIPQKDSSNNKLKQ